MRTSAFILLLAITLSACGGSDTSSGGGGSFNTAMVKIVDLNDKQAFREACWGSNGTALGCYDYNTRIIYMSPQNIQAEATRWNVPYPLVYEGLLQHEMCHDKQFMEGRPFDEKECTELMAKVLEPYNKVAADTYRSQA